MKKEQFIDLARKYAEGTATEAEIKVVENFFDTFQNSGIEQPDFVLEARRAIILKKIKKTLPIPLHKKISPVKLLVKIAAAVLLFLGLIYAFSFQNKTTEIITYSANEEPKEIKLSDGSIIILNANSQISLPEKFGNTREVSLKGQAYFKVQRNPEKPFIVNTKDVSVKVLGTSFDINSYRKNQSQVSVLSGKVEVSSPQGKKIILTKDNQAAYKKESGFIVTHQNSLPAIAWTNRTLVFKNQTLLEVGKILQKKYDVQIDFENEAIEKQTLSGKFKEQNLEVILESIALLKNLETEYLTPKHIRIRRKIEN
ncbi:FecR family protein [Flavobacterium fluviatile]|uniref:FecR family protein n=1 Tax=Flavobacterium fluviatile TaxID=1862387 RepID=UPI0013D373FF|nr:FecR domain-containing protein [Flavobacterium fluviatile]